MLLNELEVSFLFNQAKCSRCGVKKYWAQVVAQCRVRPGSFVEQPGSLGGKYWPGDLKFDSNFENP